MLRDCPHCHKTLTPQELSREQSRKMEAERKALGLHGILFRYYECSGCDYADIFVDLHQLPGESDEEFKCRKGELQEVIRQLHPEGVEITVLDFSKSFNLRP